MNTKQCEVIGDLLPLYVDQICSEESRRMVAEHLESCNECKRLYAAMMESVGQEGKEPELDSQQAFRAISHKWKMKKISIACISIVLTALVVFAACMLVQEASSVHDYFFPSVQVALRELPDDAWQRVQFKESDALVFDSVFYDKALALDANGDGAVSIRILDGNGDLVLEESVMEPGSSLDLDALQSNTEYMVEVKTTADFVLLNFY